MRFAVLAGVLATVSHSASWPQATSGRPYVTVSSASGKTLFKVAATMLCANEDDKVYELYDAGDHAETPAAVYRMDSGLRVPLVSSGLCAKAKGGTSRPFQWLLLQDGVKVGSARSLSVDATTKKGWLRFYVQAQSNTSLEMPFASQAQMVVVRERSYCALQVDCSREKPTHEPPPSPSSVQKTCHTDPAYAYPQLLGENPSPGVKEYPGMLKMWPPIDNESECSVRQLIFNIDDDLVDGLGGAADSPTVKISVRGTARQLPLTIYSLSRVQNGGLIEYRIDAQTAGAVQVDGDYFAEILISGKPKAPILK